MKFPVTTLADAPPAEQHPEAGCRYITARLLKPFKRIFSRPKMADGNQDARRRGFRKGTAFRRRSRGDHRQGKPSHAWAGKRFR
jgi:hypothetical protein